MKVNVLTNIDIKFKKWHWWSDWIDIAVYDYEYSPHLIQMKIGRNNSKKFRSISISGVFYRQVNIREVGDLTQMERKE